MLVYVENLSQDKGITDFKIRDPRIVARVCKSTARSLSFPQLQISKYQPSKNGEMKVSAGIYQSHSISMSSMPVVCHACCALSTSICTL